MTTPNKTQTKTQTAATISTEPQAQKAIAQHTAAIAQITTWIDESNDTAKIQSLYADLKAATAALKEAKDAAAQAAAATPATPAAEMTADELKAAIKAEREAEALLVAFEDAARDKGQTTTAFARTHFERLIKEAFAAANGDRKRQFEAAAQQVTTPELMLMVQIVADSLAYDVTRAVILNGEFGTFHAGTSGKIPTETIQPVINSPNYIRAVDCLMHQAPAEGGTSPALCVLTAALYGKAPLVISSDGQRFDPAGSLAYGCDSLRTKYFGLKILGKSAGSHLPKAPGVVTGVANTLGTAKPEETWTDLSELKALVAEKGPKVETVADIIETLTTQAVSAATTRLQQFSIL